MPLVLHQLACAGTQPARQGSLTNQTKASTDSLSKWSLGKGDAFLNLALTAITARKALKKNNQLVSQSKATS